MEKNRIHKPRKEVAKCVDDKTQDKKCVESLQKSNNGRIFQFTKFSVLDFVRTEIRNL